MRAGSAVKSTGLRPARQLLTRFPSRGLTMPVSLYAVQWTELSIGILIALSLAAVFWIPYLIKEIRDGKGELGPLRIFRRGKVVLGPSTPVGAGDNQSRDTRRPRSGPAGCASRSVQRARSTQRAPHPVLGSAEARRQEPPATMGCSRSRRPLRPNRSREDAVSRSTTE